MAEAHRPSYKCPFCTLVAPTSTYIIDHQVFAHSHLVQQREDALIVEVSGSQGDVSESPDEPLTLEVTCEGTPHPFEGSTQFASWELHSITVQAEVE